MSALKLQEEIKAKQAELQAELDRIADEARLEKQTKDANDSAIRQLNRRIKQQENKNTWIKHYAGVASSSNISIKSSTVEFKEVARAWFQDYETVGEHTAEQEVLTLVYKVNTQEFTIDVDDEGMIELPYNVAKSFRKYKNINTVMNKLIEHVDETTRRTKNKNQQETANQDAIEYLKSKYPTAEVKLDTEWVRGHSGRYTNDGYTKYIAKVTLDNGVTVFMNITPSNTGQTFALHFSRVGFKQVKNCDELIKSLQNTDFGESFK